jgi:hypothetical protein
MSASWTTFSSSPRPAGICRAVKAVNQTLAAPSLEKHVDKTFIGKIERGLDFLGYHFGPTGLTVAKKTIANFIEHALGFMSKSATRVLRSLRLRFTRGGGSVGRAVGW